MLSFCKKCVYVLIELGTVKGLGRVNVTRLLIKDNPMLRGGQTIGLTFY